MTTLQLVIIVLVLVIGRAAAGTFDDQVTANTTLYYSEVAYCGNFATRAYNQEAAGFVFTNQFDGKLDTLGFMGYNPNDQSIYISYRGSQDIENWVSNVDILKHKCPSEWGIDKCEVHAGFYAAENSVIDSIWANVQQLTQKYPSYRVVVTGHSLGGALATLTAVDLVSKGVEASKMELWNFGSPRVGNEEFAQGVSERFSIHRVTHHKDMVPHVPTHHRFQHIAHEWYEDPTNEVKACSGYEDDSCSYQWHITSISDHLHYLGRNVGSDGCSWL